MTTREICALQSHRIFDADRRLAVLSDQDARHLVDSIILLRTLGYHLLRDFGHTTTRTDGHRYTRHDRRVTLDDRTLEATGHLSLEYDGDTHALIELQRKVTDRLGVEIARHLDAPTDIDRTLDVDDRRIRAAQRAIAGLLPIAARTDTDSVTYQIARAAIDAYHNAP